MLTWQRLHEVLNYNIETGLFRWKVSTSRRVRVGDLAGTKQNKGYWSINIDGKSYLAQRLAWFYITKKWPEKQVDHLDLDKLNNRFANLRSATNSQNHANRPPQRNNTSGFKGVYWNTRDKCWRAQITIDGKRTALGTFKSAEMAHVAYVATAKKMFGEFARAA